jgi:hypothetical protein
MPLITAKSRVRFSLSPGILAATFMQRLSLRYPYDYTISDSARRQYIATRLRTLTYGRYAYSLIDTVLGQRLGIVSTLWKRIFFMHEKDLLWFFAGLRKASPKEVFDATPGIPLMFRGHYERIDNQEPFNYLRLWVRTVVARLAFKRYQQHQRKKIRKRLRKRYLSTLQGVPYYCWNKERKKSKLAPLKEKRLRLRLILWLFQLTQLSKQYRKNFKYGSTRLRHFFRTIRLTRHFLRRHLFFPSPSRAAKRLRGASGQKFTGRSLAARRRTEHPSFKSIPKNKQLRRSKTSAARIKGR